MSKKKIAVIGAGFAGLSAACCLADAGFNVTVFEKNASPGGRARKFDVQGFTFDMGPSWYWMPDVFERFFNRFGKSTSDYYTLQRLNPSYKVFFKDESIDIPAALQDIYALFDTIEPGSSTNLRQFLEEAAYKYEVGINDLVYKPGRSVTEFLDMRLMHGIFRLHVFNSIANYIRKYFSHPKLIQLLEFPILFLGAMPRKTPALYSLMNYADMALGTWYPEGGMHKIVEAMETLALSLGVRFEYNAAVSAIEVKENHAKGVVVDNTLIEHDIIIGGADYHHIEQHLLPEKYRKYDQKYWDKRALAPSSLIFYLGVDKKISHLLHHNLFFDEDFEQHAQEIYEQPGWPQKPLFYVCCTSKTDPGCAPEGMENLFVLIPVAPGLEDRMEIRERYYDLVMDRIEKLTGEALKEHIVYKRSYAHNDFIEDYNAFRGNAYGLANTLRQTAILKPSIHNRKVRNLFYTGQLTVPGPGVPPSIISGQVVAGEVIGRYEI
ncbi:Phytoene dehydrogenase [Fulvivirga imtechensis AK7]|uniref:Phytoene dehydrogenase n=1 Tax=Fulvivirga imtechensis AK7 TaxID=1237149 RepID=L8JP71_9BACT|nr:phytoene desaturase family protein [Fulvivirga imtechensis]ELR70640.1 Phytoene dehydrogenase [Fulvivirga imtechensis AK7]